MDHLSPWVPESCFASRRAQRTVAPAVANWSDAWFAGEAWTVLGPWEREATSTSIGWRKLAEEGDVSLHGRADTLETIALAILDAKPKASLTPPDMKLMWALAEEAVEDLLAATGKAIEGTASSGDRVEEAHFRLAIGPVDDPRIVLRMPQSTLAATVRSTFDPLQSGSAIAPRLDALQEQTVAIGAHLGSATLSIAALSSLECGDVILLDRPVASNVGLLVDGRPSDVAMRLSRDEDHLTLESETTS